MQVSLIRNEKNLNIYENKKNNTIILLKPIPLSINDLIVFNLHIYLHCIDTCILCTHLIQLKQFFVVVSAFLFRILNRKQCEQKKNERDNLKILFFIFFFHQRLLLLFIDQKHEKQQKKRYIIHAISFQFYLDDKILKRNL